MKLSELEVGKKGVIVTVANESYCTKLCAEQKGHGHGHLRHHFTMSELNPDKALRHHLLDMGLTPGTIVAVRKTAPLGDPIELTLRGYELTLRKEDAEKIEVEPGMEKIPACTCCTNCTSQHLHRHQRTFRKETK